MNINRLRTILNNIFLVFRNSVFFMTHGRADKELNSPQSVVIIQRAKLGDMVSTTPMFRAIKNAYPNCKVTVVGSVSNKEVLDGNRDVDDYIVWKDDIDFMIRIFKQKKFDFGCMTSPNFHSLSALYLSGIKSIAAPFVAGGWSPYQTKPYKMVRRFVISKEHRMGHYAPGEFLKLLEPIGIFSKDTKKHIFWSDEADLKISRFISGIKEQYSMLVGIMPGVGNEIKRWPSERFAEIVDYLIEKHNAFVVLVGGNQDKDEIDIVLNSLHNKNRVVDGTWVSIDELKALVAKLDMTVSVDTGPIHIAQAAGVPTIDIIGPIDPNEMAPNDGEFHLIVKSPGAAELWTMNSRVYDYEKARGKTEAITVLMVTKKIDELVKKIRESVSGRGK